MVRVISVHHFASQQVQTVEQPTACIAARDRLLLALSNHSIEVRDLSGDGSVLFAFPTVDEVTQLHHSSNGNYVATVETKFNRQNRALNFVRVYVNWDSVATLQQSKMNRSGVSLGLSECGMVQPMRARIAGRVTPTTVQSELGSLEMIEVPTKRNPSIIAVCQISGNILIASQQTVTIYEFRIKLHDISRLRFIDFEEFPLLLELNFAPTKLSFCENYVACMSKDAMHLFKIIANKKETDLHDGCFSDDNLSFTFGPDECIDFEKVMQSEKSRPEKHRISVNLPSIVLENSAIHKSSPFTVCDRSMTAYIRSMSPIENRSQQYHIVNLIQIRLKTISVDNGAKQITEEFKAMELKPLYVSEHFNKKNVCKASQRELHLQSEYNHLLNSVACLIVTQQEGYMYQFSDRNVSENFDHCVSVYPFTAPVYHIVLENYFLHAITEAGLESYTLRIANELCNGFDQLDDITAARPSMSDSICLVGLRPFLGVERIILADSHLVLLANAECSPTHSIASSTSSTSASYWTMYNLELPPPRIVYNDISIVANTHRFTSSQTYCHLLTEAHMILRTRLLLKKFVPVEVDVGLVAPSKGNTEDVVDVYRSSCALLGDHYIMCPTEKEYTLAVPYYKMSAISPHEVLSRVKKIQEESNNYSFVGLINYLRVVLLDVKFIAEIDRSYNMTSKQSLIDSILDVFHAHSHRELPVLILKSRTVREHSTEKLLTLLGRTDGTAKSPEKALALAVLYLQLSNVTSAQNYLQMIDDSVLEQLLLENWELLFEAQSGRKGAGSFSDLTSVLVGRQRAATLGGIFVDLIQRKCINLNKLLRAFIEYLPSSEGLVGTTVFQTTLELFLKQFYQRHENEDPTKIVYYRSTHEAVKLLVRTYLSQLQLMQMKESSRKASAVLQDHAKSDANNCETSIDYLFADVRFAYLNEMPPFQPDISAKLNEKQSKLTSASVAAAEANLVLKKLQALLCSQAVPNQVIIEVNTFLGLNENLRGHASLQSIIMTVPDAVQFLIEECPQCLLQFAKDRFTKIDEWKNLVATIQRHIIRLCQDKDQFRACAFFKKVLRDILTHVATNMTLEHLVEVFPQHMQYSTSCAEPTPDAGGAMCDSTLSMSTSAVVDGPSDILSEIQNYEPYITICKETMHANQIKKLITATGQQLLSTLNL